MHTTPPNVFIVWDIIPLYNIKQKEQYLFDIKIIGVHEHI